MPTRKIKLTRPELKRQRDTLARYERFLPTLKLKHRLLQKSLLEAERDLAVSESAYNSCDEAVHRLGILNTLTGGLDVAVLSTPTDTRINQKNVAGVKIPVFVSAHFQTPDYSVLFTPPHVDETLKRWRARAMAQTMRDVQRTRYTALKQEFVRVNQRLNLFEKVVIPQTREAIQRIRIYLGDEQTAAVGRAKLSRGKQLKKRAGARHD